MRLVLLIIAVFTVGVSMSAQTPLTKKNNKGRFYAYWGWNRALYSNSDIHFTGDGYDFTLLGVRANDRQSEFGLTPFFKLGTITIPQTNFRLGYYFNEKWSISGADDHMKYVMVKNQTAVIDGSISDSNTAYDGDYNEDHLLLSPDFLRYEHTDGLNYLNVELRRHFELYNYKNLNKVSVNAFAGGGLGFMMPKTNATLLANERHDEFHLAGWGSGLVAGLDLTFWQVFFVQVETKGGYISMPDIRTTQFEADHASQNFFYWESVFCFGGKFGFNKKKKSVVPSVT